MKSELALKLGSKRKSCLNNTKRLVYIEHMYFVVNIPKAMLCESVLSLFKATDVRSNFEW